MPWIHTVEPEDADGRLAEAYQWQARKLGRPTEFTQLGSLDAEVVHARLILYRASENVPSRLSPRQKLLISYLTSILNETPHCASLARTQLGGEVGGDTLALALDMRDYAALGPRDAALAQYRQALGTISALQLARQQQQNSTQVAQVANSATKVSPKVTRNVLLGLGLGVLAPRQGQSIGDAGHGWSHDVVTAPPGTLGDSGSPFLDPQGAALGPLASIEVSPVPGSNGIGDLARELAYVRAHSRLRRAQLATGTEPFTGHR